MRKQKVRPLRKHYRFGIFLGILICMLPFCAKDNTNLLTSNPSTQVFAHRGGASIKPENSLVAFHFAIAELGADAIEFDVRQTSDQELIINHDSTINPSMCLNSAGNRFSSSPAIYTMTLAQVQAYDCGTLVGLDPHTPLPTLAEMLNTVEKLKTPSGGLPRYILHVKYESNTVDVSTYVGSIVAALAPYNLGDRLSVMSDKEAVLTLFQQQDPTQPLIFLNGNSDPGFAISLPVQAVAVGGAAITPALLATFHGANIPVYAFTVDNSYQWVSLINMGVDGIVTNNPVGLVELLAGNTAIQRQQNNFSH